MAHWKITTLTERLINMNIAAYCRVSTDKEDQLNSLETQKEFFLEYTNRTSDNLIKLYADESISGTKIKNRKEFQRMLADAEKGKVPNIVYEYDKIIGNYFNLSINEEEANVIRQIFKWYNGYEDGTFFCCIDKLRGVYGHARLDGFDGDGDGCPGAVSGFGLWRYFGGQNRVCCYAG